MNETKTRDRTEHTVVIPKYGPCESLGPSQKLYTPTDCSKTKNPSVTNWARKLTKSDESMCTMMSLTEYDGGSYNGDERNINERVPEIVVAEMGRESFQ